MEAVRSGAMEALITQPGHEIGYRAVECALAMLEGEEVPAETLLTGQLLTRDTMDGFDGKREG